MFTFLRQIRKSLVESGSARKYLLYAIGEILLVVIGILIALQINNWNEWRKDRVTEREYLIDLQEDFLLNQSEYAETRDSLVKILSSMVLLLEQSSQPEIELNTQVLNRHFSKIQSMPNYDETDRAYSTITGSGKLGILQNKSLRNVLAKYFSRLKQTLVVQNTHELELVETFQPYIIDHMDYQAILLVRSADAAMPPRSQDEDRIMEMLKDRKFRNILTQKWTIVNDLLNEQNELQELRKEVLSILESEIKK